MLDGAKLLQNGKFDYIYLDHWCTAHGGKLAQDQAKGYSLISFSAPPGLRPIYFWLPHPRRLESSRSLQAAWDGGAFTGKDAYLPGMLAILLQVVADAGGGAEIVFNLGESLPEHVDREAMHYFLVPTDFQLALAYKGEYLVSVMLPSLFGEDFGFQENYERENRFIRDLEETLAPAHSVYPVGPGAPAEVRPYFLLGHRQAIMKSLVRDPDRLVLSYRVNSFPEDGPAEIMAHFQAAVARAGYPDAVLETCQVYSGGRSPAMPQDLELVYSALSSVLGMPPDIDWYMWPLLAGELSMRGYKTAAFGPGCYRDYQSKGVFDQATGEKLCRVLEILLGRTDIPG